LSLKVKKIKILYDLPSLFKYIKREAEEAIDTMIRPLIKKKRGESLL
jgi:hypothetical protein